MILNLNYEILFSFLLYLFVQIVCKVYNTRVSMHSKPTLISIPERSEADDEEVVKWVSKKKHEVLKAKYKCLKKLFQIYDASVIGILPEPSVQESHEQNIRKKKSCYTKSDAVETNEINHVDSSAATAVVTELKLDQCLDNNRSGTAIHKFKDDKSTQDSNENLTVISEKDIEILPQSNPYLVINQKRKPTRFQTFLQRILGIRRERYSYVVSNKPEYAVSDNYLSNRHEKRRRRGIRLRRSRPKKIQSELMLRDVKNPVILSFVQSIQRNCLTDTTPRHCPMLGCKMVLCGIINYNDHLNLCHFPDRTYICVYCHEGFSSEYDKSAHENEHIGLTKMAAAPSTSRFSTKIASNTQTDPEIFKNDIPQDKLKKIISFFDKISDPDQMLAEIKKSRCSEANLLTLHRNSRNDVQSTSASDNSDSENTSLLETRCKIQSKNFMSSTSKMTSTGHSEGSSNDICKPPVRCQLCGENFDYRHELNHHVDKHHRISEKVTKFNSCAGILNRITHKHSAQIHSTSQSLTRSLVSTEVSDMTNLTKLSRRKYDETLTRDQSMNIVYFTSQESLKHSVDQKVQSNFCYKWEPGTKIIRV